MNTTRVQSLNPCFNGRYSQRVTDERVTLLFLVVLILVLMEDTLRDYNLRLSIVNNQVLILVLMEDTLRGTNKRIMININDVLILVLMEDTLRVLLL